MSEGNRFVVEIVGQLQEASEVTVSRVCDALGLDEVRAAALVARMPGVITRPAGEDRAMKIALRLQGAGVPALHRPLTEDEEQFQRQDRPTDVVVGRPKAAPDVAPLPAIDLGHGIDPLPGKPADAGYPAEAGAVDAGSPTLEVDDPVVPSDIPSLDVTHHDVEVDPKLTPMSEAGFGAADILLPTKTAAERPNARPTFVEAGPLSVPTPVDEEPAQAMIHVVSETPASHPDAALAAGRADTPVPDHAGGPLPPAVAELPMRPLTPVSPVLVLGGTAHGATAPVPAAPKPAPAEGAAPTYRQTRSSADQALKLTPPPDEVLKRSGIADSELDSERKRRRGGLGRHLAAQVALPGLLTWSLTAVALWWFLGADQSEVFVGLAAATALAALIGSLIAALGTTGLARDVVRMRDEARRIAMGDLTAPVASNRDDELGEIAGSLERMRLSLQEGMERLRQRRR